jgi:chromosome segregation ATPase
MNLVTDFERLNGHEDLRALISSLEQRMDAMDNRCSRLEREVEKERNQTQQYLSVIEDQTRELDKLRVALRTVEDEASQERERQHVLIARLRASVRF